MRFRRPVVAPERRPRSRRAGAQQSQHTLRQPGRRGPYQVAGGPRCAPPLPARVRERRSHRVAYGPPDLERLAPVTSLRGSRLPLCRRFPSSAWSVAPHRCALESRGESPRSAGRGTRQTRRGGCLPWAAELLTGRSRSGSSFLLGECPCSPTASSRTAPRSAPTHSGAPPASCGPARPGLAP